MGYDVFNTHFGCLEVISALWPPPLLNKRSVMKEFVKNPQQTQTMSLSF